MTSDKLEQGQQYMLSFTKPIYDRERKRYLPDRFRFTDPHVERVFYGGRCEASRYCVVCGRKGTNSRIFVRESDFKELYVSDHCFRHPATKVWPSDTTLEAILSWYKVEDRERAAEAGDPLAAASLHADPEGYFL